MILLIITILKKTMVNSKIIRAHRIIVEINVLYRG